jgi:aryl-alcohol dehydrogenase-like predicted oxidoreductase
MYFGSRNDRATSYRLLDSYVGAGGSFIDTANIYAHWVAGFRGGESETLLGEWMTARGNRSSLFIASKVGFNYGEVPKRLRSSDIQQECDKSLRRMNIDTIDLYYAHVDDRTTPLEESLHAFDALVRAGKVRFVGASNFLAWRLEQARWLSQVNGWSGFCCVQQHYTFLRLRPGTSVAPQEMVNDDLLDYCKATGLTLLAYSVLQSGAYSRPDRALRSEFNSPDNERRLAVLREIAGETDVTVNQVILSWMLHTTPTIIPLIAASTEEQLQENMGALDVRLTAQQMAWLDQPITL